MIKAEVHTQEADRLEALRQYKVLDTPPEEAYDDITAMAAGICNTPVALISLVDEDRQGLNQKLVLLLTKPVAIFPSVPMPF